MSVDPRSTPPPMPRHPPPLTSNVGICPWWSAGFCDRFLRELYCVRPRVHSMLGCDVLLVPGSFPKDLPAYTAHLSSLLSVLLGLHRPIHPPALLSSTHTLVSPLLPLFLPSSLSFLSMQYLLSISSRPGSVDAIMNVTVTLLPEGSRGGSPTVPPTFLWMKSHPEWQCRKPVNPRWL